MEMTPTTSRPEAGASRWVARALWVALTVALLVAARGLPWSDALRETRAASLAWLAIALALNLAILPLWALEWRLLTPRAATVAWRTMFEVVTITASVMHSIPFLAGEFAAVALLVTRAGLSRGAALSVMVLDQLLVGFGKLVVLAGAALSAPLPAWLRAGVLALVAGVALLAGVVLPLAHRWVTLRDALLARPSRMRALLARVAALGQHLDAVRDFDRLWRVALIALLKRALELSAMLAVQMAFGVDPSFTTSLLLLAALTITTALPIAPGSLGIYEATAFTVYRYAGLPSQTALALALVQHLCFLVPMLSTGYLMLTLRQTRPRSA